MCCDYILRRYFCGVSAIGAIGGFSTLIYGASNLPYKLPDKQVNWGGTIISQPNDGSAQDLQDYRYKSYEYKLITIGGIVMGCCVLITIVLACFGLSAPVVRRRRNAVLPVEVERPTIQIISSNHSNHDNHSNNHNNNDVERRIRSPSSLSPQLTQAKHNRWKTNEMI